MDNFHLQKFSVTVNKEKDKDLNYKTRNIKFEQEEEIVGTIGVFRDRLKQEKCIKMEPMCLNESDVDNNGRIKHMKSNGFNSRSHHEFKNINNHLNNFEDSRSMSNLQTSKKRKLSLRIDTVESLSPQKRQEVSSESSEESSPKQSQHFTKGTKDEERSISSSSKHKLLKNGNDSFPYKKFENIPIKRSETHRQDSSQIRTQNSQGLRLESLSPSSRKINPLLTIPLKPQFCQKKFSANLKVFKGLDLMCWETDLKKIRTNEKYEIAYRNMTKKYPLIALFKCMGKKCSYAADDPLKMLNHLTFHDNDMKKQHEEINKKYKTKLKTVFDEHERNKLKLKESEENISIYDYFLCCSYCQLREKNSKSLVHHINDIHRKDIYQCGFCFFRSCVKETCLEHWEMSHKNKPILIYECRGKKQLQLAKNKVLGRLLEKRKTYVVPLMCKVCEVGYYPLKEFLEHCERDHREEHERTKVEKCLHVLDGIFKAHHYGMFQCLYCVHGCHKQAKMESHLIQHPSEFGFYCIRQPKESKVDDPKFYNKIESTRIMEVQKEVKVMEFNENPDLLDGKNYKEIIDSDLQKWLL